jgi:excinuclease UvrABC helicase subunit UvrB
VIILWADKVTDNLPKAIKKAKYKGKGGKAWDDQYEINAKEGSGTVFFVDAKNVADAKEKIQGLTKKNNSNVYHVNERLTESMTDDYVKVADTINSVIAIRKTPTNFKNQQYPKRENDGTQAAMFKTASKMIDAFEAKHKGERTRVRELRKELETAVEKTGTNNKSPNWNKPDNYRRYNKGFRDDRKPETKYESKK